MKTIRLRPGKERSLLRRHPWLFEGSVAGGKADSGETVRVEGSDGRFLAWAAYSPLSSIRARAWSFDEGERIDAAFFARRIAAAVGDARAPGGRERRRPPGARRGRRAAGAGRRPLRRHALARSSCRPAPSAGRRSIADALLEATGAARLYERSDTSARQREGLAGDGRLAAAVARGRRGHGDGADDPRARLALRARRRDRPQDRLLSRPARQPQALRRDGRATSASRASSTATATPAASASPRSPAARPR